MKEFFKWDRIDFIKELLGTFLMSFAINTFIVSQGLFNGGILGISELLRDFIVSFFHLHTTYDFSGIINFIINIPILLFAYNKISKVFFRRTLLSIILITIFLSIIPTTEYVVLEEKITYVLLGGIVAGIGSGLMLSASSSSGGMDIVGIAITSKNRNLSVGKIGFICNLLVFITCGIIRSVDVMIYSIIYASIVMIVQERTHDQNVCTVAMIFTKNKPTKIIDYIINELDRDATTWEAIGIHQNDKTYVCYVVLSRYELQLLERNIKEIDEEAFLVKNEDIRIRGNFNKRLVKD